MYNSPLLALAAILASPAIAQAPFGAGSAIAADELATVTGRADISADIRAQNSATVSQNNVSGVSETGTISFDSGAFQSMSGLSLLSANTGNNVSINSSLNVNVSIAPQ